MADLPVPEAVLRTMIAEALGEPPDGMRMVGETIITRANQRGMTPEEVVMQPYQYTGYSNPGAATRAAWNDPAAMAAAQAAWELAQGPDDPTGGANHYFNPNIVMPSWAAQMTPTIRYGDHAFYTDRPVPQRPVAPNPASLSPSAAAVRQMTSPSGGNGALQTALNRIATREGNRVTPMPTIQRGSQSTRLPAISNTGVPSSQINASIAAAAAARPRSLTAGRSGDDLALNPVGQNVYRVAPRDQDFDGGYAPGLGAVVPYPGRTFNPVDPVGHMPTFAQFGATVGNPRLRQQQVGSLYNNVFPAPLNQLPASVAPTPATPSRTLQAFRQAGSPVPQQQSPAMVTARNGGRVAPVPFARPNFGMGGGEQPSPVPFQRPIASGAPVAPTPARQGNALPQQPMVFPPMPMQGRIPTVVVRGANVIQPPAFLSEAQRGVASGGSAYDRNQSVGAISRSR